MDDMRLVNYINVRLEQLNSVDTSNNEVLENQTVGKIIELLKFSKMLHNDGVVRTMTNEGIKIDKY